MPKVVIKFQNGDIWIHHFMSDAEAKSYLLGIREMAHMSFHKPIKIKLDGKEVYRQRKENL